MRSKYYPPVYNGLDFHCILCEVYADQKWHRLYVHKPEHGTSDATSFEESVCKHCGKSTYWYSGKMIVPSEAPVEPPHVDLPLDCLSEYNEARGVFIVSARASAALLRLCIQKLMPHLGEKGKNIDDDIKSLVAKGLPVQVQQALDYCRVVGNGAVHPSQLDLNDTPDIAQRLFEMINFIVEDRITRPREINELYNRLPKEKLKAIEERDKGNRSPSSK